MGTPSHVRCQCIAASTCIPLPPPLVDDAVRTHVSVGALAGFAASSEFTFGTLSQRVMTYPNNVRFHYGHPDIWNKLYMMTRGGLSKATKCVRAVRYFCKALICQAPTALAVVAWDATTSSCVFAACSPAWWRFVLCHGLQRRSRRDGRTA